MFSTDTERTEDALPAPGTWAIDPGHTEVAFIGRHFMLTKVRGRFEEVRGTITTTAEPTETEVFVEIDMVSVNSGSSDRDEHLRSAELFDVAAYPTASFRSTSVDWNGPTGTLHGELTIKGVSRPVTLDVTLAAAVTDPWGNDRLICSASGHVDRDDWGITWNMPLANGGLLVSRDIRLEIEMEAVRQA
jgi:polyisoprenoid-binding protein YceI